MIMISNDIIIQWIIDTILWIVFTGLILLISILCLMKLRITNCPTEKIKTRIENAIKFQIGLNLL